MEKSILKKISALNGICASVIREENNSSIFSKFTEESVEILDADFGFAFEKFNDNNGFEPVYKSKNVTFNPILPKRKVGHQKMNKRGDILFDSNVRNVNYISKLERNFKSLLIIPIHYGDHIFGNIVLVYKNQHNFTENEFILAETIENMVSRAVNINWLIEREQKSLALAEKQRATEMLLSQEKLKTEFIANATHELRTPLAIMKGNVDLALMEKLNLKTAHKTLKDVNVEINILSNILKDLSLITSGQNVKHIINPTKIDIAKLIDTLAKRLKTMAADKNITITVKNKNTGDLFVSGEERYLEKLFINLIKNAITYGKDNGNIIIDISAEKNNIKIKVTDDGIGISKEDLPKIFERFYRGDKAHTHNSGNQSGLGLAIAKWATEIHGGTIETESVLGKSSTFTVTLPKLIVS